MLGMLYKYAPNLAICNYGVLLKVCVGGGRTARALPPISQFPTALLPHSTFCHSRPQAIHLVLVLVLRIPHKRVYPLVGCRNPIHGRRAAMLILHITTASHGVQPARLRDWLAGHAWHPSVELSSLRDEQLGESRRARSM